MDRISPKGQFFILKVRNMVGANKNDCATTLKEIKRLCEEFVFTDGMLKGTLAQGRKVQ